MKGNEMKNVAATPFHIGSKTIRNRVTFAPAVKFDWTDVSGIAIERFARHYEERAAGGAGLIVVEATAVVPTGRLSPDMLGLWEDAQIAGHRAIAEACHRHGAVVLVQISHAGMQTHEASGPMKGPSQVPWRGKQSEALTLTEIHQIRDQFIETAIRAQKAGYDGIQLHACHSYLINQFICARVNLRTDEYGGSVENRARFGCEIIRGIREACGADFVISARTPGAEPTLEDAFAIADAYIEAGVDFLQISGGIGPEDVAYPDNLSYGWIAWSGAQMFRHVAGRVPVSVVCGILDPALARQMLSDGLADAVDSCRALLADPGWARAVTDGAEYVHCRDCSRCLWSPGLPHRCPAAMERKRLGLTSVDLVE